MSAASALKRSGPLKSIRSERKPDQSYPVDKGRLVLVSRNQQKLRRSKASEGKPEITLIIAEWMVCGNARSFGSLEEAEASERKPDLPGTIDKKHLAPLCGTPSKSGASEGKPEIAEVIGKEGGSSPFFKTTQTKRRFR